MKKLPELKLPDEILKAAHEKESQAHQFYCDMLGQCRVDVVRQLLERLKDEEYRHIRMIEDVMARLRLGKGMS